MSGRREYILTLFVVLVSLISPSVLSSQRKKLPTNSKPPGKVIRRPTVAQALQSFRSSIVQINAVSSDLLFGNKVMGTGFVVGDGNYVITNHHVVNAIPKNSDFRLKVSFPHPRAEYGNTRVVGIFSVMNAYVIDEDIPHDLALLRLEKNVLKGEWPDKQLKIYGIMTNEISAAKLLPGRPTEGAQLIVAGYPFENPSLIVNSGYLASAWGVEYRTPPQPANATVLDYFNSRIASDFYYADIRTNRGNSGGPVFSIDDNGVIGVCAKYVLESVLIKDGTGEPTPMELDKDSKRALYYNAGIAWIIPASYVIKLLEKNKVPTASNFVPHGQSTR